MEYILRELTKRPYLWILILVIAIRLWGLADNPIGISHDEIHDIVNAKSLSLLGEPAKGTVAGIFGKWGCEGNCVFGELGSYLLVPWLKIVPMNIFWVKIPFLIAGLAIVYFGARLIENLSDKRTGVMTALLLSINPWVIHFGRSAYENLLTFGFYLAGLFLISQKKVSVKKYILAMICLILGFMGYMGAKPLLPLLVMMALIRIWPIVAGKTRWATVMISIGGLIFFGGYMWWFGKTPAAIRMKEAKVDLTIWADQVNQERRMSFENRFTPLLINKYTVMARGYIGKYLNAFDLKSIFFEGERWYDVFTITNHGYLYLFDLMMVGLGLMAMGKWKKRDAWWLIGLILISPVPGIINRFGTTFTLRGGLMFPLLVGVAATGAASLLSLKKWWLSLGLGLVYFLSFGYFLVMYWNRMPFEESNGWFGDERVLVKYLDLWDKNGGKNMTVCTKEPIDVAYLYGFYTGKFNSPEGLKELNRNTTTETTRMGNIEFRKECDLNSKNDYIVEKDVGVDNLSKNWLRITEPRDNGERWVINSSVVCNNEALPRYAYPRNIRDYQVESMNEKTFCEKWIVKF